MLNVKTRIIFIKKVNKYTIQKNILFGLPFCWKQFKKLDSYKKNFNEVYFDNEEIANKNLLIYNDELEKEFILQKVNRNRYI